MFEREIERATFLLGCNALVFVTETAFASRVRQLVSDYTLYFCFLYFLTVFQASRPFGSGEDGNGAGGNKTERQVWASIVKVVICLIPASTMISFFGNLQRSIVDCLAAPAFGGRNGVLDSDACNVGGSVAECNTFVQAAKRHRILAGCPSYVLGDVLGAIYVTMVFSFRFCPCLVFGTYFATTFREDRLWVDENEQRNVASKIAAFAGVGAPSLCKREDVSAFAGVSGGGGRVRERERGAFGFRVLDVDAPRNASVPTTFLLATSLLLWGSFAVEFGSLQAVKISSSESLLLYFAILLLQLRFDVSRGLQKKVLAALLWTLSRLLVVYVYADTLRNGIAASVLCAGARRELGFARCPSGDRACLDAVNALRPSYFLHSECRQFAFDEDGGAYYYLAQGIRIVVLGLTYPLALFFYDDGNKNGLRVSVNAHPGDEFLLRSVGRYPQGDLDELLLKAAQMNCRYKSSSSGANDSDKARNSEKIEKEEKISYEGDRDEIESPKKNIQNEVDDDDGAVTVDLQQRQNR